MRRKLSHYPDFGLKEFLAKCGFGESFQLKNSLSLEIQYIYIFVIYYYRAEEPEHRLFSCRIYQGGEIRATFNIFIRNSELVYFLHILTFSK